MEGIEAAGEVGAEGWGEDWEGNQTLKGEGEKERDGGREGDRERERERESVTLEHVRKKQHWNKLLAASFSDVFSLVRWTVRRRAMATRFLC